jgi:hypothetical protein
MTETAFSLDIHRERSTRAASRAWAKGCERPQPGVFWQTWDGQLLPVRCGASNRCLYCSMLAARETALVVKLDALTGSRRPTWGLTTTTHRPDFSWDRLRVAEQKLWRALRDRYGSSEVQYLGFVEWTTGEHHRAGWRLPHVHHLVKGIPESADSGELTAFVSGIWKHLTRGAWVVDARELRTPAGAIAYFVHHHEKTVQGPPKGTRNVKRVRPSKGYFDGSVKLLRAEAKAVMADDRLEREVVDLLDAPDRLDQAAFDEIVVPALERYREVVAERRPKLVRMRSTGELIDLDRSSGGTGSAA